MGWLKVSDQAATHPIALRALSLADYDDRILNELFGWMTRCATQSAAHDKDYIVEIGVARHMAGPRFDSLVAAAVKCGYITEVLVPDDDGTEAKAFRMVEEPDLFHMMNRAERDWDNQRQRDNRDPALTGPVRARDGDACRYCGKSVRFGTADRKSGRVGTIDHLHPGDPGTVDTLVVACRSCNSKRKDDPTGTWETRPVPKAKLIGPETAKWLTETCGIPTQPTYKSTAQLKRISDQAEAEFTSAAAAGPTASGPTKVGATENAMTPSGPAPAWATAAPNDSAPTVTSTSGPTHQVATTAEAPGASGSPKSEQRRQKGEPAKPGGKREAGPSGTDQTRICDPKGGGSGFAGSGRDGKGRAGPGSAAPTQPRAQRRSRPRRRPKHK